MQSEVEFNEGQIKIIPQLNDILQSLKQELIQATQIYTQEINSLKQILINKQQQIRQISIRKCPKCVSEIVHSPYRYLNEPKEQECLIDRHKNLQEPIKEELSRTLRPMQLHTGDGNQELTNRKTLKNKKNSCVGLLGKQNCKASDQTKHSENQKIKKIMRKSISVNIYNLEKKKNQKKKTQVNPGTTRETQAFIPINKINMLKKKWIY